MFVWLDSIEFEFSITEAENHCLNVLSMVVFKGLNKAVFKKKLFKQLDNKIYIVG